MIFDWDVTADQVFVSPEVERMLGLKRGVLEGSALDWLDSCTSPTATAIAPPSTRCSSTGAGTLSLDFRLRSATAPITGSA